MLFALFVISYCFFLCSVRIILKFISAAFWHPTSTMTKSCYLFSQKNSIINLSLGPKCVSVVMRCAILYYLYNLKNVKNIHGEVLLLVKLQASTCNLTKSNIFSCFFNCTNGTISSNASIS